MKSKIIYIGEKIFKVAGGADQVNKRNQELLENEFEVTYFPLHKGRLYNFYLGVVDSYLKALDIEFAKKIYDYVYIPQSLLGRVCKYIKKKYPKIKIIVFFHNIEVQYAREYCKVNAIRALPFYVVTKYWEAQCCKFADYCITLNNRDSILLQQLYHREAAIELPTSFKDTFDAQKAFNRSNRFQNIDYLFVGVAFFANTEAVQWFINKVLPKIDGHLYVVGKGMDSYPFTNTNERVHIYGYVDDLSEYYYNARMVVSPIHVGGGMKTKTAEALMYGKIILGSKEAFEGYEINPICMHLCESADDYVREIEKQNEKSFYISDAARNLFLEHYSNETLREKFHSLVCTMKAPPQEARP